MGEKYHYILYAVLLIYSHHPLPLIPAHLYTRASSCRLFFLPHSHRSSCIFTFMRNWPADATPPVITTNTPPSAPASEKRCHTINEGYWCKPTCLNTIMFAFRRDSAFFTAPFFLFVWGQNAFFPLFFAYNRKRRDETSLVIFMSCLLEFMNKWMN